MLSVTHARELLMAAGAILAGWLLLSGAVYAAAACVAVPALRFRRCLVVTLPIAGLAIFLPPQLHHELGAPATVLMLLGFPILAIVLARYLLRTTWLRALATLAVTCLYAFALGAMVYRILSGVS